MTLAPTKDPRLPFVIASVTPRAGEPWRSPRWSGRSPSRAPHEAGAGAGGRSHHAGPIAVFALAVVIFALGFQLHFSSTAPRCSDNSPTSSAK